MSERERKREIARERERERAGENERTGRERGRDRERGGENERTGRERGRERTGRNEVNGRTPQREHDISTTLNTSLRTPRWKTKVIRSFYDTPLKTSFLPREQQK